MEVIVGGRGVRHFGGFLFPLEVQLFFAQLFGLLGVLRVEGALLRFEGVVFEPLLLQHQPPLFLLKKELV